MKNRPVCFLLCLLFLAFGSLSWAQDGQVQEERLCSAADTSVSDRSFLIRVGGERKQERRVNYGSSADLSVVRGRQTRTGGHINWCSTLIQFDLSEIPPGSEILEARLFLYHYNVGKEQISIHRMLKNWRELEATWSEPCKGCDPWGHGWNEGNYVRTPTFSRRVTEIDQWFDWDVTEDVKVFLGGTSNCGWFLKSAETTGSDSTPVSFYSKDSKNPTLRPYLQVRFRNPPPPLAVEITSPTDGAVVNTSPLIVTGTVSDPTATVTVNGTAASISGNTFEASVPSIEGSNTITVEAQDSYGQRASHSIIIWLSTRGPLVLTIDSPKAGANLSKSEIMVEGTVSQEHGLETGVVVNGRIAVVTGNRFVANRVPLEEGENQITAVATDVNGNTTTASVTVDVTLPGHYIRLTANIESGIAPLETILTLDTSLDPTCVSVTYTGPGDVEYLSTTANEYRVRLNVEGTYFFTAEGTDSAGVGYSDTVALSVLSKEALDTLLRGKWEGFRLSLVQSNIDEAVTYFDDFPKDSYRKTFEALSVNLPQIAQQLADIRFIAYRKNLVEYDIRTARRGKEFSFYLLFVRDKDGLWKIRSF